MKKLALTGALLGLWATQAVHAAEFFCSNVTCLIASINQANGLPGEHTIFLEPGTYTLTAVDNDIDGYPNGLPSITGTVAIRQNDQSATIERDPGAVPFRLFHVAPSGNLRLYGLGLRNGFVLIDSPRGPFAGGGAIYNRGSLFLEQLAIYQNETFGIMGTGGAILNEGQAILVDTELTLNAGEFFQAPNGAAIRNRGELTITRGLIRQNGGESVGGIASSGQLTMSDSAVVENIGAGLSGSAAGLFIGGGTATVINSTIARNKGGRGGIQVTGGVLRIINSTVAENNASVGGPPDAGGINNQFGTVELQNTILAANTSLTIPLDCQGPIISLGNNIIGTISGCTINLQQTDLVGDPELDNFAGTFYPLLPDSPAIDSGNPKACPVTDQLGLLRLGICDIGSVEFQGGRMVVSIDIRPNSDANKINPNSTKNINVAILSGDSFDATTVDPNTVRFGATGTEAAPIHVGRRDVDGDGDRDMVLRFQIQGTEIKCGDTSAFLTGQTSNGVSIMGSSPIKTVQCK